MDIWKSQYTLGWTGRDFECVKRAGQGMQHVIDVRNDLGLRVYSDHTSSAIVMQKLIAESNPGVEARVCIGHPGSHVCDVWYRQQLRPKLDTHL
jgi:hypothetical protein